MICAYNIHLPMKGWPPLPRARLFPISMPLSSISQAQHSTPTLPTLFDGTFYTPSLTGPVWPVRPNEKDFWSNKDMPHPRPKRTANQSFAVSGVEVLVMDASEKNLQFHSCFFVVNTGKFHHFLGDSEISKHWVIPSSHNPV